MCPIRPIRPIKKHIIMSPHITSETKRRLALGLAPELPKSSNRRRRLKISFTVWDMCLFGSCLWIIGFLSGYIHFSP